MKTLKTTRLPSDRRLAFMSFSERLKTLRKAYDLMLRDLAAVDLLITTELQDAYIALCDLEDFEFWGDPQRAYYVDDKAILEDRLHNCYLVLRNDKTRIRFA